jgi:biopolymer transport protein ExbD
MSEVPLILPKLPARRRRTSFVLTSLIDVIFLLVIFFMVSSQVLPYSLIPLGPAASGTAPAEATAAATAPVSLRIQAGRVSIGGQPVEFADLSGALTELRRSGVTGLVLSTSSSASVQDLVTVLELCRTAAFDTVTVLNRRAAAP